MQRYRTRLRRTRFSRMLQIPRITSVILGVFKKCSRQFVGHTHDQQIIYANICVTQSSFDCLTSKVLMIEIKADQKSQYQT